MDEMQRDLARWKFGDLELDEASLELRRAGQPVAIERKPLELLMLLLRHPGEVLTKDELLGAVWSSRVLSESVLTKCVAKLRQALGDEEQLLLKTVHGYGYRLMAGVTRLNLPMAAVSAAVSGLAEHRKTRERRVFKFASGADGLRQLQREITIFRLLLDTHGPREDLLRVLDWNLDESPFFIETEFCAGPGARHRR